MTPETLAALVDGPPCPKCGTTMNPWTVDTWHGVEICCFCKSDLDSHDAEDARRNIRQHRMERISLTVRERYEP